MNQEHQNNRIEQERLEAELAELDRALTEHMPIEAPEGLSDRIFDETAGEIEQVGVLARVGAVPKDRIPWQRGLAAAAAVLLIAGLIIAVKTLGPEPSMPAEEGPIMAAPGEGESPTDGAVPVDTLEREIEVVNAALDEPAEASVAAATDEAEIDAALDELDARLDALAAMDEDAAWALSEDEATGGDESLGELLNAFESQIDSF